MVSKRSKKSRVSHTKKINHKRNKLSKHTGHSQILSQKQGKLQQQRHKKSNTKKGHNEQVQQRHENDKLMEVEESDHGEEMLDMIDEDDLSFLRDAAVNKSYSMLKKVKCDATKNRFKGPWSDDDHDKFEEEYEKNTANVPQKTKLMLPIKTKQGLVRRIIETNEIDENVDLKDQEVQQEVENAAKADSDDELIADSGILCGVDFQMPISTAKILAMRENLLQKQKFRIGVLASGLLENPEEKVKNFKKLLDMLDEADSNVGLTSKKYCLLSLLEVFKDVLPSYQIKPLEKEGVKLKKETFILQNYEKSLLNNYKNFLQKLEKIASELHRKKGDNRIRSPQEINLAEIAVTCMCDLLVTHPYFNFSKNLAQLLVLFLNNRRISVRRTCEDYLKRVFKDDKRNELSLHIVRRINYLVKSRSNSVHCEVLTVLLSLRIKDVNLDQEKQNEINQKKFMTRKQKLLNLSKNERKRSKKLEKLEKELLETKAEESKQSKHQNLTEITKMVFTIYFRILKNEPSSKLLSLTLEGLAKFSHCINLDFFHDIVNVIDKVMLETNLGIREELHCVQTVFTILSDQGEVLTIDPLRFYTHLYRNLLQIITGKNHSDLIIVLRTLELVLIRRGKKVSQQRLIAFVKRLGLLALQVLHNGSLSCLQIIKTVIQQHKPTDVLLDCDSTVGQGKYSPELDEPEYCNAGNSALWELTILQRHYHSVVRKFATNILNGFPISGEGSIPIEYMKLSAEELFTHFDPAEVKFVPSIPTAQKHQPKTKPLTNVQFHFQELSDYSNQLLTKNGTRQVDFYSGYCKKKIVTT